jgi:hypothetical protein
LAVNVRASLLVTAAQANVLVIIMVRIFSPGGGLRNRATFSSACAMRFSRTDLNGHAS